MNKGRLMLVALLGAVGTALYTQEPEIRRYLKIKSM